MHHSFITVVHLLFCVGIQQVFNCQDISIQTLTHNCLFTGHAGVRDLTEGFPLGNIGDMYLHSGNTHCLQCVQNGDRRVGVGGGVDHNAIKITVCGLNLVYQVTLMV